MRKLLLAGLLIAFAGIGLAQTPEIVNPPRPTKNYRWLLIIQQQECLGLGCRAYLVPSELNSSTYFIYVNDYELEEIDYLEGGGYDVVSKEQKNQLEVYLQNRHNQIIGPIYTDRQHASNDFSVTKAFLKAPAPKPIVNDSKNIDRLLVKLVPQKAKVVFTTETRNKTKR